MGQPLEDQFAEFMADEECQTLTLPCGLSASKMTPEDEAFAYVAAQQPHLAVVEQKDGVIYMEVAPNLAAAGRLCGQLLHRAGGIEGGKWQRFYVRRR